MNKGMANGEGEWLAPDATFSSLMAMRNNEAYCGHMAKGKSPSDTHTHTKAVVCQTHMFSVPSPHAIPHSVSLHSHLLSNLYHEEKKKKTKEEKKKQKINAPNAS